MLNKRAIKALLQRVSFRQAENLDTCNVCKRDSHTTVCGVCLACDEDIQARRKGKRAYFRQQKRREFYGAFSGYLTGRTARNA